MSSIYLPIRALGDFIITAAIVKINFKARVPVVLPEYLADIYNAIGGDAYFEVVNSIPFQNQPAFFELYKVRDVKNLKRLRNDLHILNSSLTRKVNYLLDYSSRRLFFTGFRFTWPARRQNIYLAKTDQLISEGLINAAPAAANVITPLAPGGNLKIVIIPESRIKEKSIDKDVVKMITDTFSEMGIKVALFSPGTKAGEEPLQYSNFEQLISIIKVNDLVICAESLPYHLANFFNKPHFVIYNRSRHLKTTFMTPFMKQNSYHTVFNPLQPADVLNNLKRIIYGSEIR